MAVSSDAAAAAILELGAYSAHDLKNPAKRKKALGQAQQLAALLQEPVDIATQLVFSPYLAIAARIAVDLELFARIEARPGPVSTAALAEQSHAEPLLITRLLRLLAGVGYVAEAGQDVWGATPLTHAMASSPIAAGHRFVWDVLITSAVQAPAYLRSNGNRCPTEPNAGLIQFAKGTTKNVFEYLAGEPSLLADFNNFMGHTMGVKDYWVEWYPVQERLLQGADRDKALLVDIGGGRGHDLQASSQKYPGQGRLILQDLRQGLDSIGEGTLDVSIERMEYDFFTAQPVQGARAYFVHHILHDWSEKYCRQILAQIRTAMTPGYSKLLIHDLVLPDTGANPYRTTWDMTMMTFNGGMERSRTQWNELLEEAGFMVVAFHVHDPDADGIVEAVVQA